MAVETKYDGHSSLALESQKQRNHGVYQERVSRVKGFSKSEEAEVELVETVVTLAQFILYMRVPK